jgi:integrase
VGRLLAALNWACKPHHRLLTNNPIKGIDRPPKKSRGKEALIEPEDHERLYAGANRALKEVLVALQQTGARPGSVCVITARDVNFERQRIELDEERSKTGRPLYIPMTGPMMELCQRLCERHPTGPIFRTLQEHPWTSSNIQRCLSRLHKRLGLQRRVIPYGYRHTAATELLLEDMPPVHVATVLGHKDTDMVFHHYGHLVEKTKALAERMDKILNG